MNSPFPSADSRKRRVLYAGVGLAALAAGAGVAWWKRRPSGEMAAFWSMDFTMPAGGSLAASTLRGKPLLVNFWAPWCAPCVEEMPLLNAFYKENKAKGWQVLGLAVDHRGAVQAFLARVPVTFPIGLAGLGGMQLGRSLGNLSGGLPFTIVIGQAGEVLQRKMGRVSQADLVQWASLS